MTDLEIALILDLVERINDKKVVTLGVKSTPTDHYSYSLPNVPDTVVDGLTTIIKGYLKTELKFRAGMAKKQIIEGFNDQR